MPLGSTLIRALCAGVATVMGGLCVMGGEGVAPGVAVDIREFSGVCQGGNYPEELHAVVGWNRHDVSWQHHEPKPGEVNTAYLDKIEARFAKDRALGRTVLPMLGYAAEWAMVSEFDVDISPFQRRRYTRDADGKYRVDTFSRERDDAAWGSAVRAEISVRARAPLAPGHVAAWERYVETVVRRLMAPPCNLEYFQIWNEAHPTSSFFHGSPDAYMETIHLPAARVIRRLGGKVVYGGWPCAGPVRDFVDLLDRHQAWDTLDVLSVHYYPLPAMAYLDRAMKARGVSPKGIWQTEFGFVPDPNFVANNYPRVLRWSLDRGWRTPHDYKLFFFAQGSPDDPKAYGFGRCLMRGPRLTGHGQALSTFASLLGGGSVAAYDAVETSPPLAPELDERLSAMEAFQVGQRIVLALHLIANNTASIFYDRNGDGDTLHLNHDEPVLRITLPALSMDRVESIARVGQFGPRLDITARARPEGEGLTFTVPVREARTAPDDYTAMPVGVLPQTFYVDIVTR